MNQRWTGRPGILLLNEALRRLAVRTARLDMARRLKRTGAVVNALIAQVKRGQ